MLNRKELIKRLDRLRQTSARYDGAFYKGNELFNRCITCGRILPIDKMDGGHFIPRGCQRLRWDICNVNCQCQYCNRFKDGAYIEYSQWFIKVYGEIKFNQFVETYKSSKAGKIKPYNITELRHIYNDWLRVGRDVEEKYKVKLFPKAWKEEDV